MIWFLIGLMGAGSIAGFGEHRRRAHPGGTCSTALAPLRGILARHWEIRRLSGWYQRPCATEAMWRRWSVGTMLLLGPLCALAGAGVLASTGTRARPGAVAMAAAVATVVLVATALWRTVAALAVAANVLGIMALLISRATATAPLSRATAFFALVTLAGLVGLSAVTAAMRQPSRYGADVTTTGATEPTPSRPATRT